MNNSIIFLDLPGKAIVYVTFSKNKSENEEVVHAILNEQGDQRSLTPRKDIGIYK